MGKSIVFIDISQVQATYKGKLCVTGIQCHNLKWQTV